MGKKSREKRERRERGEQRPPTPPPVPAKPQAKHPETCDFCNAPTPMKDLAAWPCDTYTQITALHERTAYVVCTCHTLDNLPPGATVVERRNVIGAWAACPACRTDVDAARWDDLARRNVRVNGARLANPADRAFALTTVKRVHAMFGGHAVPYDEGRWQPATDAYVDAEIALYRAQRDQPPTVT